MKKILTADNTETFLNEEVNESYHSLTGAVEEALKKYAIPCRIVQLAKEKGRITILDMFFGLGYNSAMAIDVALKENPHCEIEVIGLEKDGEIIKKIQEVNPPIKFFRHYKKLNPGSPRFNEGKLEFSEGKIGFGEGRVQVTVLLGDARETVKQLKSEYFDAIFYDPFSPRTSPKMWSEALFREMHRVMKNSAILATYSCARLARENMAKAGLFYDEGPVVGRRGPGTIATKWLIQEPGQEPGPI